MEESLRREVEALKQTVAQQETMIKKLLEEHSDEAVTSNDESGDDHYTSDLLLENQTSDALYDDQYSEDSFSDSEYGPENRYLPSAHWDGRDCVLRCLMCSWEVVEGVCQSCQAEFRREEIPDEDTWPTENKAVMDDRCLAPRGTTPLRFISESSVGSSYWTRGYCRDDFVALLKRGATEAMCYKFFLEFTQEKGIVAWADKVIYERFSGPGMQVGDCWKFHLRRYIQLERGDLNGSVFVQDLLEDVLAWSPPGKHIGIRWETVEETPGIWVTRPIGNTIPQPNDDDSYHSDDYEEILMAQHDDEALEHHNHAEGLPPVLQDEYESSDAEYGSDVEMEDSSWAIQAHQPDAIFVSDSERSLVGDEDTRGEEVNIDVNVDTEVRRERPNDSDDSADSDFDLDEVLSGDEYVLRSLQRAPSGLAVEKGQRRDNYADCDFDSDGELSSEE